MQGSGDSVSKQQGGLVRMLENNIDHIGVVIIGAGAGGLCMAANLQRQGIYDYLILEKGADVGGTWRENTYPGAACDIPSHLYSFSFAPNPNWSRAFAPQPEILAYFQRFADQEGLRPRISFGQQVTALEYQDDRHHWLITTTTGKQFTADTVINGLGQLHRPFTPDIPGLAEFEGVSFHSAQWQHDVDLKDKRVAVIGVGASAIQFVPEVAQEASSVTIFQRSSNYVVNKPDRVYKPWHKWMFANIPGLQKLHRQRIYWTFEARFGLMKAKGWMGKFVERKFKAAMGPLISDKLTEEMLVPDYTPGCKRLLLSNNWYPTLLKPHVKVTTSNVSKILGNAVITDDGEEHDVDVIIFGTGFHTTEFMTPMKVVGRNGADLHDTWQQGAQAYLGLAVPKFPNLFMLYGPNTNLGHNSILFMLEQQTSYISRFISSRQLHEGRTAEVTEEAARWFDDRVQTSAAATVWVEGCSNWYVNEHGRLTNNWPESTVAYRKLLAQIRPEDWRVSPRRARQSA